MAKAKYGSDKVGGRYLHFMCPGCNERHFVTVETPGKSCWGFNGNLESPTLTPSVLVRSGHFVTSEIPGGCYCDWPDKAEFPDLKCRICHSYVRDGMIQFLGDCTHELACQTVPLPEID